MSTPDEKLDVHKGKQENVTQHVDVVVVGAGTAGSVVTRRLIDGGRSVMLLEAGGADTNPSINDMAGMGALWHGPEDWDYYTVPQPHADNRSLHLPRGKVLGGSHALNAAIWVRGAAEDFDGWVAQGCTGWGWTDVLPVYQRIENYHGGEGATRGVGGPVDIVGDYPLVPIQASIIQAATETGLPLNEDYNDGSLDGVSQEQITVRDGKRLTTYSAYVKPVADSPLLTVVTGAWVHRLLLEGTTARGVEFEVAGELKQVIADVIVLAAGALDSPRILLRSGIGPAQELEAIGIAPVHDLPGVGKNLHDHFLCPVIFATEDRLVEALKPGESVSQSQLFWRSHPNLAVPDTQPLNFSVPMYDRTWMSGPPSGFTLMAGTVTPYSRGELTLTGSGPRDKVAIDVAALKDDRDVATLVASIKQCREIGRAPSLAEWGAREIYPGPDVADADLAAYVRKTVTTYHHQVGTCKMGTDPLAVVDPTLRVHGMTGLWVIDASVMPTIITGNTNAPTAMIGERGAEFILAGSDA